MLINSCCNHQGTVIAEKNKWKHCLFEFDYKSIDASHSFSNPTDNTIISFPVRLVNRITKNQCIVL